MSERSSGASDAYDGLICDLDGVVYIGQAAVPGAAEALDRFRALGLGIVYATNNAARLPSEVAAQLAQLGVTCTDDDVVTSAQAGAAHLATVLPPRSIVLALGGPGVAGALRAASLIAVAPGGEAIEVAAVLQGLGRELTVTDFEVAARHLTQGALWVATNPDATFPLEWGLAPGNGAYVRVLEATTGRHPIVVGKPEPPLYELATERLGTETSRTLAIGDRLDTDIDGAAATGIDSAWVLTGVDPPSALFRRPGLAPPTFVVGSLTELFEANVLLDAVRSEPEHADEGVYRCSTATAKVTLGQGHDGATTRLELRDSRGESAPPMPRIRAGLAALLAVRDRGDLPLEQVETLARDLDGLSRDGGTSPHH